MGQAASARDVPARTQPSHVDELPAGAAAAAIAAMMTEDAREARAMARTYDGAEAAAVEVFGSLRPDGSS